MIPIRQAPPSRLAAALLAAALATSSILAGCGPGTGGTGTGQSFSLSSFGASAANLCSAGFAPALACGPNSTISITPGDVGPGTTMVQFADLASGGNVAVTFQANSVQLQARCQRINFAGDWGITAPTDARFFGNYVIETIGTQVPASVSVQALAGGALQLVLREADGRVVLGPVLVQKVAAPVAQPAPCP